MFIVFTGIRCQGESEGSTSADNGEVMCDHMIPFVYLLTGQCGDDIVE